MKRRELSVDVSGAIGATAHLVGTLHQPDRDAGRTLFVGIPGGTSNRHYFDLQVAGDGYDFAGYLTAHGCSLVAFDNLGTGESTQPDVEVGLEAQAAALAGALESLHGAAGRAVIAVAHSMGGYTAMLQQAAHHSFDGLAILGTTNQWVAPLDFGAYNQNAPSALELL